MANTSACAALAWTIGMEELRSKGYSCSARAGSSSECTGAFLEYVNEAVPCIWEHNATEVRSPGSVSWSVCRVLTRINSELSGAPPLYAWPAFLVLAAGAGSHRLHRRPHSSHPRQHRSLLEQGGFWLLATAPLGGATPRRRRSQAAHSSGAVRYHRQRMSKA